MTKVKFGLTVKEENLYLKAEKLLYKSEKAQKAFYNSIYERFEKAGYDADVVLDSLTESDCYVFSESGCSGDGEYNNFESIWDYLRDLFNRKGKMLNGK